MFKGKKVLVSGGAGFVGTNLILRLLEDGAEVRATFHNKEPQLRHPQVEFIKADLTNAGDCKKAVEGREYVFMCAANSSGAAVIEKTPLVHVTPNVIMNALMLEAAHAAGVKKYVWLSSNTVYPPFEHPVKEEEMMAGPLFEKYFCVAWMKRFGEIMCEMYATKIKNPMLTVVVRPANMYGDYDDFAWETSHVVPALIRKVVERKNPLEVWGDGTEIKDLIYVKDFVEGLLLAAEKINEFSPVNIGTGVPVSVKEVIETLIEVDGYENAPLSFNTSKPTMIPKRLIDVSKAERVLGFRAGTLIKDGLRKTVEWYRRTYPDGYN